MKKALAIVFLMFAIGQAVASCPVYSPYNCRPGPGGKMICGCGA